MEPKIQAIFFDLGDTLVKISYVTLAKICKKINEDGGISLDPSKYTKAFHDELKKRSNSSETKSVKNIKTDAEESERRYWRIFFESLLPNLGVTSKQSDLIEWLIGIYISPQSFVCFDDVHRVLSELKAKGFILGIISNAFPSADKILDHLNLRQYFKFIFLSFEIPYAKPESMVYQFAAEKANIPVENIIFIDDRWNFVKGAQEANMKAWLIERFPEKSSDLHTKSLVNKIKSLKELQEKTGILQIVENEIIQKQEKRSAFFSSDVCVLGNPHEYNSSNLLALQNSWWEEVNYVGRETRIFTNFSRFSK
jgi:putative hydrolase of the HAD superfamily